MEALTTACNIATVIDTEEAIAEYLRNIDVKPKSKETYAKALRVFFAWSGKTIPTSKAQIIAYKEYLVNNFKASTVNSYITAIKGFYSFLEDEGICKDYAVKIKGIKNSKGFKKDALTKEQARALLSTTGDTLEDKRNHAIITLMLYTGLRVISVQRANIEDIRQINGLTVLYHQGKGRDEKDEFVVLTAEVIGAISEYLALRGKAKPTEPLFSASGNRNQNGRLTTRSISRIVKNAMLENDMNSNRLTAHSLRHTAITFSLLGGATLQEAKDMAGHSNTTKTEIYAQNINRTVNSAEQRIASYLND
jgi:site-specific recombinase XerD